MVKCSLSSIGNGTLDMGNVLLFANPSLAVLAYRGFTLVANAFDLLTLLQLYCLCFKRSFRKGVQSTWPLVLFVG